MWQRWAVALVTLVLCPMLGCSLDRAGIGVPGRTDGGLPGDASIDAQVGPRDGGPEAGIDAGVDSGLDGGIDSGIDSGVDGGIDGGIDSGIDAGPLPCGTRYAALIGHRVCEERPTECELWVMTSGASCRIACGLAGGACIASYPDGDDSSPCTRIGPIAGCDVTASDQLCVCAR